MKSNETVWKQVLTIAEVPANREQTFPLCRDQKTLNDVIEAEGWDVFLTDGEKAVVFSGDLGLLFVTNARREATPVPQAYGLFINNLAFEKDNEENDNALTGKEKGEVSLADLTRLLENQIASEIEQRFNSVSLSNEEANKMGPLDRVERHAAVRSSKLLGIPGPLEAYALATTDLAALARSGWGREQMIKNVCQFKYAFLMGCRSALADMASDEPGFVEAEGFLGLVAQRLFFLNMALMFKLPEIQSFYKTKFPDNLPVLYGMDESEAYQGASAIIERRQLVADTIALLEAAFIDLEPETELAAVARVVSDSPLMQAKGSEYGQFLKGLAAEKEKFAEQLKEEHGNLACMTFARAVCGIVLASNDVLLNHAIILEAYASLALAIQMFGKMGAATLAVVVSNTMTTIGIDGFDRQLY